jgi:16S rRNA (uracil1498-N3)-methyltransferase
MPQFLVAPEDVRRNAFRIDGPEAHHVVKVLRLGLGATLDLFDGQGGRFTGVIEDVHPDGSVTGKVTATHKKEIGTAKITLYQGLLKASHWDYALEKGTELGVAAFVPILTPRTVVLLHEVERVKAKQERWSRLVLSAAKQCGRADLPEVREPAQFRDAIRACKNKGTVLLAWEGLQGSSAADALRPALKNSEAVHLFIGPEGGFTAEEIELARAEGGVVFGMGPRILRAETAAMAAVTLVQYELGGL